MAILSASAGGEGAWGGTEAGLEATVEVAALRVDQPAPFVEVADHVDDVDAQHAPVAARSGGVAVHDAHVGIVERSPVGVDAAGDVDVLGIHEEAFVEEPFAFEGLAAEEQEGAEQVGGVDDDVVVGVGEQVSVDASPREAAGEESLGDHVPGGGESAGGELQVAVGVVDFWHHHADVGMGGHVAGHAAYDVAFPPGVGVEDEVGVGAQLEGVADGGVVAGAEAAVLDVAVFDAGRAGDVGAGGRRTVVDDVECGDVGAGEHTLHAAAELGGVGAVDNYRGGEHFFNDKLLIINDYWLRDEVSKV